MYAYDDEPICACSTPAGISGTATIRISGGGCADLTDKCTRVIRGAGDAGKVSELAGYTCCYAKFINPDSGDTIDDVVITRFTEPHSYTGEDMIEISCHGSSAVKQEILKILGMCGIRLAYPGEFSRRAFVGGKLSLSSAEAVMSVIESETDRQLRAAQSLLSGKLSKTISTIESKLYDSLATLEKAVEFDYDTGGEEEERLTAEVLKNLLEQKQKLSSLCEGYSKGRVLSERMKVALIGKPNSGKSTLLNTLTGFDRAIVTEVAGTTRDTIEATVDIDGIPVTLVDTAGIHETRDVIESLGIGRTMDAGSNSDLILYIVPPEMRAEDVRTGLENLRESGAEAPVVVVFSKNDEGTNAEEDRIREIAGNFSVTEFISVSAEEDINIDLLEDIIRKFYLELGGESEEGMLITNGRHYRKLEMTLENVDRAAEAMEEGMGVEVAASCTRAALDELGEITGKTVSANLADTIFSRFCVGK